MSMLGLGALMAGGGLLSSLGGMVGASSSNRNARRWQDEELQRQGDAAQRTGGAYFGGSYQDLLDMGNTRGLSADARTAARNRFTQSIGGPIQSQLQSLADYGAQGGASLSGQYGAESNRLRSLGNSNLAALNAMYQGGTNWLMSDFDRGARGLQNTVDQWGKGREAIIDRDAAQLNRQMDDRSRATLAASGFGNSTALANQIAGNARNAGEVRQNAMQNLAEGQIDRKTGLGQNLLGGRTGLAQGMFGNYANAAERTMAQNFANENARSTGQTQLDSSALERNLGLRTANIQSLLSQLQAVTSGGSVPYIPSYSTVGTGLTGLGNTVSGLGNLLAIQNMFAPQGGGGNDLLYSLAGQRSPRNG